MPPKPIFYSTLCQISKLLTICQPFQHISANSTYLSPSAIPHEHFVSGIEEILHDATAHDAQSEETKLHLASFNVLLQ